MGENFTEANHPLVCVELDQPKVVIIARWSSGAAKILQECVELAIREGAPPEEIQLLQDRHWLYADLSHQFSDLVQGFD